MIRLKPDEQNENQSFEPLLPPDQSRDHSPDGSLINDHRPSRRPKPALFSKFELFLDSMSSKTSRLSLLALLKWVPVAFVFSLVGWSYYAYVVQLCFLTIETLAKKAIYLVVYHLLLLLFLWSYLRTVLTKARTPTRQFYLNEVDSENVSNVQTADERRAMLVRLSRQLNLPLLTRHFDGSVRYCVSCRCVKPDRAHHCSLCQKCVLRFDHHCPWTNSCISYGNYKYFVLFLGYAFVFCLFVGGSSLEYFIQFWTGLIDSQQADKSNNVAAGKFHVLFLFFVSIMFAISVSSLFFYHLYLTAKNRTTLESFRAPIFATGPQKDGFDLGHKRNFQEIFGSQLLRALLPVPTSRGDGIHYQMKGHLVDQFADEEQQLSDLKIVDARPSSNETRQQISRSDFIVNLGETSDRNGRTTTTDD